MIWNAVIFIIGIMFIIEIWWIKSMIDKACDQIKYLIKDEHRRTNEEINFRTRDIKKLLEKEAEE
jgi:hypothetical protein